MCRPGLLPAVSSVARQICPAEFYVDRMLAITSGILHIHKLSLLECCQVGSSCIQFGSYLAKFNHSMGYHSVLIIVVRPYLRRQWQEVLSKARQELRQEAVYIEEATQISFQGLSRLAAHTNIEIFYSPWCRISRHTVVIGIYLIIRVDPKCHLAPVFADLLDWLQTNDSKNVLFQIEGHSVSSLSSKNMYDHFLPLVRKHQTNKTRSSNTFCDVKF